MNSKLRMLRDKCRLLAMRLHGIQRQNILRDERMSEMGENIDLLFYTIIIILLGFFLMLLSFITPILR